MSYFLGSMLIGMKDSPAAQELSISVISPSPHYFAFFVQLLTPSSTHLLCYKSRAGLLNLAD